MDTDIFEGSSPNEYICSIQQDIGRQDMEDTVLASASVSTASLESDVFDRLSNLYETLKEPLPSNPSASYIGDAAHKLVDGLNAKRKVDSELMERFKQSLEAQTMKCVQALEQQLYQTYEVQNQHVDKKLQELFACLDNIAATEAELENFRESLRKLYQEMNSID